jgi:hypothetical protein
MARRGRFGTPSGGANLSSLVQGLLRQKKAQEEQLIVQQFRNGQKTLSEVLAFYEDWRSTAGYSTGSVEYDQIVQSMQDVKNQDLVLRYNKLWSDFNTSNGANYQDVMDFLNNDASNTTDQGNLQSFNEAKKTATQTFIKYAGKQLSQGSMSLGEYKSLINENLPLAYEDSPSQLASAKYDALVVEYNAQKTIWDNKIAAGKPGAVAGFQNFADSFIRQMGNNNIPQNSELYTAVQAGINNARVSGSNVQVERSLNTQKKLGDLFGSAARASGLNIQPITQGDVAAGVTYGFQDLINNPGVFASLIRQVDAGIIEMPQDLIDMGINDTNEFARVVTHEIDSNFHALKYAYATNPTASLKAALEVSKIARYIIGSHTGVDEFSDAKDQYVSDMQEAYASGDAIAKIKAIKGWTDYLNGRTSPYGKIPPESDINVAGSGNYGSQLWNTITNEKNLLNGNPPVPGQQTVTGFFGSIIGSKDGSPVSFADYYSQNNIAIDRTNFDLLRTGQAIETVTYDNNGNAKYETTPNTAIGPGGAIATGAAYADGGILKVLTFADAGNGQMVPYVQAINNFQTVQISSSTSSTVNVWGYVYKLKSGEVIYYSKDGKAYSGPPFNSPMGTGANGAVTPTGDTSISSSAKSYDKGVSVDTQSILSAAGNGDPTKATYEGIRRVTDQINIMLEDPNNAAVFALASGGIDGVNAGIEEVTKIANNMELTDLGKRLTTLSTERRGGVGGSTGSQDDVNLIKARINDISTGGASAEQYKIYMANKDKYSQQPNGTFKLTTPENTSGYTGTGSNLIGTVDKSGNQLPAVIDTRSSQEKVNYESSLVGTQNNPYFRNSGPFFRNIPNTPALSLSNLAVSQSGVPAGITIPKVTPIEPTTPSISPTTPLLPGQRPIGTMGGK